MNFEVFAPLLHNPLVLGAMVQVAFSVLKTALQKVDDSDAGEKAKPWIQPAVLVLTFVVSALNLATEDKLHNALDLIDPNSLVAWVYAYIGAKAVGTNKITEVVGSLKNGK